MPTTTIVTLSLIVGAYTIFAVALAWGEYQTRALIRKTHQVDPEGAQPAATVRVKAAAPKQRLPQLETLD